MRLEDAGNQLLSCVVVSGAARSISRRYIADFVAKRDRTKASAAFVGSSAVGMAMGASLSWQFLMMVILPQPIVSPLHQHSRNLASVKQDFTRLSANPLLQHLPDYRSIGACPLELVSICCAASLTAESRRERVSWRRPAAGEGLPVLSHPALAQRHVRLCDHGGVDNDCMLVSCCVCLPWILQP